MQRIFKYGNIQNTNLTDDKELYNLDILLLEFCTAVWSPHHTGLIKQTESVQCTVILLRKYQVCFT